jgi:quercetin dioxygenase-like cupin family protein
MLVLIINGQEHTVQAGDSWEIPGNIQHSAKALENSIAIEVFVPVREDYID